MEILNSGHRDLPWNDKDSIILSLTGPNMAPIRKLDIDLLQERFAETVKDTVAQDIGPLVEEIVDLSKRFASIKAVCYKEEVDGLHVIFCAPRIQPEEHLCLAEKFLSVADKHPFVYVEFAISSLPPGEHALSGMKVIPIKSTQDEEE